MVTEYTYDSRGRTTSVSKSDGYDQTPPTTSYSYDDAGQLVGVTDARGYTTAYEYNSRGLLSRETLPDPDGAGSMFSQVNIHAYDDASRLIKKYGMFTRLTQYEYDNRDRVTKLTLPDADDSGPSGSPILNYTYDTAGNKLTETDPLGNVTTYTYDKMGRVKTVTAPDPDGAGALSSPVTSFVYDSAGKTTSVTDPNGGVTSLEHDNLGRQTKVTQPDPDGGGSLTAPITLHEYSGGGKLSKTTDPEGRETTFQYDVIGRRNGVTDDLGNQTSYAYDNFDNVTSITEPDPDGAGALTASVTTFTYDVFDRVTQKSDPEGGVTVTTYDDAGNVLSIKDPVNNTTSFAYDGMGRVTIETNQLSDTRSFQYEAAGNLARRTDRNGRVIQYAHDNLERLTKEQWYTSATPTPALTVSTTTEGGERNEEQYVGYTSMVWSGSFTLTVGSETTGSIAYNATAAQVQTALEALTAIDSGEVAVTKEVLQNSTKWNLVFQDGLAATDMGQTAINTGSLSGYGFTAVQGTTAQGGEFDEVQLLTLANASGGTFRLAWLGETTGALDYDATAAEVETALEGLNALDQVTVTGSSGGPWTVTFAGTHAELDVDPIMGDATSATSGTLIETITLEYDKTNHITSADDSDSSYAYSYDDLGRLLTVDNDGTSGVPRVILTSGYDAGGNRTSLAATIDSTDDFENAYSYDALNRLTRLDQIGVSGGNSVAEKRVDFSYNAVGQFDTIARYNDTAGGSGDEIATSTYSHDGIGRLTGLDYEQGGTDLFTPYSWSFDNASRITQFVSADGTSDYTYDKTSQLTAADHDYQSDESYSFDANGNRDSTGYSTGTDNRLTADGTYSYTYDDEGNRTSRTNDSTDYETLYEWDFRNRLTSVTELDDSATVLKVVEYTYDVFNRRIAKAVDTTSPFDLADAVIERYVYDDLNGVSSVDGGNVVLDFVDPDGNGSTAIALSARQLYANRVDQILAKEDVTVSLSSADRVQWPLVDNLGTVRDIVENDGTLGEHYEYDSFGNIVAGDTSVIRYLYTSREHDPDTGLQYNRARWYDAAVGRWISQDPIGFAAGDANLARYVANGVISGSDPSGLEDLQAYSEAQYQSSQSSIQRFGIWVVEKASGSSSFGTRKAAPPPPRLNLYQQAQIRRNTQVQQVLEGNNTNGRHIPRNMVQPHEVDAIRYAASANYQFMASGPELAAMPFGIGMRRSMERAAAAGAGVQPAKILSRSSNPSRVTFMGMEVRAVRSLSHVPDSKLRAMAKEGFAAKDIHDNTLQLHHLHQNPHGPIVEIPAYRHNGANPVQHPWGNSPGAGLTPEQRDAFDYWREHYWKARALNELVRRGIKP